VESFGGVLEHPEASHAFKLFGLPIPPRNGVWVQMGIDLAGRAVSSRVTTVIRRGKRPGCTTSASESLSSLYGDLAANELALIMGITQLRSAGKQRTGRSLRG
jgi:hypothetical protein